MGHGSIEIASRSLPMNRASRRSTLIYVDKLEILAHGRFMRKDGEKVVCPYGTCCNV